MEPGSNTAIDQPAKKGAMVALAGLPNVGKSTLINALLGQKVSIVSRHPHTTRRRALGACYHHNTQLVICDTPGLVESMPNAMHRAMQSQLIETLQGVDLLVWMLCADKQLQPGFDRLRDTCQLHDLPLIVVINKIDRLESGKLVLPLLAAAHQQWEAAGYVEMVPISARTGANIDRLKQLLAKHAPHDCWFYREQELQQPQNFYIAEIIREKILWQTRLEVPHQLGVAIESIHQDDNNTLHISARILVEKSGQKMIVIGRQGEAMKRAATKARIELERSIHPKIMLRIFVQIKPGWRNSADQLQETKYLQTDSHPKQQ